jgi:hypothetical protein
MMGLRLPSGDWSGAGRYPDVCWTEKAFSPLNRPPERGLIVQEDEGLGAYPGIAFIIIALTAKGTNGLSRAGRPGGKRRDRLIPCPVI